MIRMTVSLEDGTVYSKRVREETVRKILRQLRSKATRHTLNRKSAGTRKTNKKGAGP